MHSNLFVTGMGRSGTTLATKLLGGIPRRESFAQPLPLLLVEIMRDYLRAKGADTHHFVYPLSDEQFEHGAGIGDFTDYLRARQLTASNLEPILKAMTDYSGQYFKPQSPLASLRRWPGGPLAAFADHYFACHRSSAADAFVWKETLAEAYIPYLIRNDWRIALVVRDPRDVAASFFAPGGSAFAGAPRPLLWMVRQWRKSAAYAFEFLNHDRVKTIRYEELVQAPAACLEECAKWLGTSAPERDMFEAGLGGWVGNSSFEPVSGVSDRSIGRFADALAQPVQAWIEALCYGEMITLGYQPAIARHDIESSIVAGPGQDFDQRSNLAGYFYSRERRSEELRRWRNLSSEAGGFDAAHHVFKASYNAQRQTLAGR